MARTDSSDRHRAHPDRGCETTPGRSGRCIQHRAVADPRRTFLLVVPVALAVSRLHGRDHARWFHRSRGCQPRAPSLGVAYVTHRYFENPIRHNLSLVKSPKLTLAIASALAAVSLVAAELALHYGNHLDRGPKMQALARVRADFAEMSRRECVSLDGSTAVKTCVFGAPESTTNIVLFGDSHAAQWFDAMKEIVQREHWRLTTVLKLGCAAVDVNPGNGIDDDQECVAWRQKAVPAIVEMKPTLIILGSATNKLDRPENPQAYATPALVADVREGVLRTLRPLSASGARLALLRDTPEFPFDVTSCLARAERHSWYPSDACDLPSARVLDPRIYAAEQSAAAEPAGRAAHRSQWRSLPARRMQSGCQRQGDVSRHAPSRGKIRGRPRATVGLPDRGRAALTLRHRARLSSPSKRPTSQARLPESYSLHPTEPGEERGRRTCTQMPFQSYDWAAARPTRTGGRSTCRSTCCISIPRSPTPWRRTLTMPGNSRSSTITP